MQSLTLPALVSDEHVEIGTDGAFTRSFTTREDDVWFVELRSSRP